MKTEEEGTLQFQTQIKLPGIAIELEEVDVNILNVEEPPALPIVEENCYWDFDISIGTDIDEDEPTDALTCYINAALEVKGNKYPVIRINTLHTYLVSKLKYKKAHEELYKSIARESVLHAGMLLQQAAKNTAWRQLTLPENDEEELNELATEWNKRGYIPRAHHADENALGRKLKPSEMEELSARSAELVAWIDAADEKTQPRTEEENIEYYTKYAEWSKLNKQLWHFKLIARNHIAYTTTKMLERLEKALIQNPDDYLLRETYENMKDSYLAFMEPLRDEFNKN